MRHFFAATLAAAAVLLLPASDALAGNAYTSTGDTHGNAGLCDYGLASWESSSCTSAVGNVSVAAEPSFGPGSALSFGGLAVGGLGLILAGLGRRREV